MCISSARSMEASIRTETTRTLTGMFISINIHIYIFIHKRQLWGASYRRSEHQMMEMMGETKCVMRLSGAIQWSLCRKCSRVENLKASVFKSGFISSIDSFKIYGNLNTDLF